MAAQRKQHEKNKMNKWKKGFLLLAFINVSVIILLLTLIFWPVSSAQYSLHQDRATDSSSEFFVRTTKENLNDLINAYISQSLGNSGHQYSISLEEDVHLIGELPVFSSTVPLSARLEPIVQDNGDVILQLKSISVGLLELPNQKIMEYMGRYLPMPEWVTINPRDEEIYVAVTEMDIRSNFEVEVDQIDLEANNIAIRLRVPYRTLGIDMSDLQGD